MIIEKSGDLLKEFEKGTINVIAQSNNCMHTMGSGVAKQIKNKYPEAYEADRQTTYGSKGKLGTFSKAKTKDGIVYNLYGQYDYGGRYKDPPMRDTRYDALYDAMVAMKQNLESSSVVHNIGFPARIGSALGGASWRVIREMIFDIFEDYTWDVYIFDIGH